MGTGWDELGLLLYHDNATCCLGLNEDGVMRDCGDGMDLKYEVQAVILL
jgi:hypothetical protein